MKIASITEAKNHLSALLERVRNGETIIIRDRERAVARLEPVGADEQTDASGRLAHLEHRGIIRRAKVSASKTLMQKPPPRAHEGHSILRALLAERDEAR